jgi:adhesin/invasin
VQAEGVSGSPVTFTATAIPGPASADKSTVSATPGAIAASTGSVTSAITITVRDSRGNPLTGQAVTLTATGSGVTLTQPGATDASGVTTSRFSATASGDHVISAVSAGVALGNATVTVTPGAPVVSSTSVDVPNGTAGIQTTIHVRLQDQFGNAIGGAAGQIAVSVSGANSIGSVAVADQGDGTYLAGYTPARVGTDQVDVRVGGQPAPGSPFTSAVVAGAADPGQSTAIVPDGDFGTPLAIVVNVNDSQGNSVGRDGDLVQVTVEGIPNGSLAVEYVGGGTYRAVWTPLVIGSFKVHVALNGTEIAKSPFTTRIRFLR